MITVLPRCSLWNFLSREGLYQVTSSLQLYSLPQAHSVTLQARDHLEKLKIWSLKQEKKRVDRVRGLERREEKIQEEVELLEVGEDIENLKIDIIQLEEERQQGVNLNFLTR